MLADLPSISWPFWSGPRIKRPTAWRGCLTRAGSSAHASALWARAEVGNPMTTYQLKLEAEPAYADIRFLLDRLYEYNVKRTGRDDGQWLTIFLRDETDRIVAGLHGWTWGGWLKISFLWVSPEERRQGRGRQLLLAAEAEARKRGCAHATLNTFNFQAPGFYPKFGYRIVGTIEGLPDGHRQYTLVKDLILAP